MIDRRTFRQSLSRDVPTRHTPMMVRMVDSSDARDRWSVFHFSVSNPPGPERGDAAALLRRAADALERLGDVQVMDLTFDSEVTDSGDDLTITVYDDRVGRRQ